MSFIIFFIFVVILTDQLPLFTPFNWSSSVTGYIIEGPFCQIVITSSFTINVPCGPSALVVDPQNQRWLIDLGVFGGKFIAFPNSSYVVGDSALGNQCATVAGWNYSQQVNGYKSIVTISDSTDPGNSIYAGLASGDIGACKHGLFGVLNVRNNIVFKFYFSQLFPGPFGPNGTSVCTIAEGVFNFDTATLINHPTKAQFDPYFVLPPGCETPIDYCQNSYPPGNPCIISQ